MYQESYTYASLFLVCLLMNYPEDIFIGGPITTVANLVVEVYDPIKDETAERLLLSDQKNRTMLFFYPQDFSFICPTELHRINELVDEFRYEHTEVLVISRDSALVHKNRVKYDEQLKDFKIKMVSDRDGVIGKDIGIVSPLSKEYERCSLIVAPNGKVAHICVVSGKLGRNIDELLRRVKALNHLLANPDDLCKESWQESNMPAESCEV